MCARYQMWSAVSPLTASPLAIPPPFRAIPTDVRHWLSSHTAIPKDDLERYVEAFSSDGAVSMAFLVDAE